MATIIGIMSLVTGSSALVIEIYDYPIRSFGYLFALTGISILTGSAINRRLLKRFDAMQMIGVGAALAGVAGSQLLIMAWLGQAPFWWIWASACLFMFSTAFLLPNATALALDPVPEIAGVAASVIGTIQSVAGAGSAVINGALYTGTILNVALVVGMSGVATTFVFLVRRPILGTGTHHG
jgi:DHA1 family bicyclomycin/chloramphenicol resistance-like MFS transporter